jgi:hypothetical protein
LEALGMMVVMERVAHPPFSCKNQHVLLPSHSVWFHSFDVLKISDRLFKLVIYLYLHQAERYHRGCGGLSGHDGGGGKSNSSFFLL